MRKFILLLVNVMLLCISARAQVINVSAASGTITTCQGTPSANPNLQQFTVSGSGLTANIFVTAPAGFEMSTSPGGAYGNGMQMIPGGGAVTTRTIYVRASAAAPAPLISGNITLTSSGATTQTVAVNGTVNALPVVNPVTNQTVNDGQQTAAVNFSGTAMIYKWEIDRPEIGIIKNGSDDMPAFIAKNETGSPVTATVKVTPVPEAFIYLANFNSNTVSVIKTGTNTVVATVPVGQGPYKTAVIPNGSKVYIQCMNSKDIYVLDAFTNSIAKIIPIDGIPMSLTLSPDGTRLYVISSTDNSITVINTADDTIIKKITGISDYPQVAAISKNGKLLYVATYNNNTLFIINTTTNTIEGSSTTPQAVTAILESPDASTLYLITNHGEVGTLNLLTMIPTTLANVGGLTYAGALSLDGSLLYLPHRTQNYIAVINTSNGLVTKTINAGQYTLLVIMSEDGKLLYSLNAASKNLSVISTIDNSIVKTVPLSGNPTSFAMSPEGDRIYITYDTQHVDVFNTVTNTIIGNFPVGNNALIYNSSFAKANGCEGTPITFTITVNGASPTIFSSGIVAAMQTTFGDASASQSFTVSGSALTEAILVTPPAGFEVSKDNINFSPSVTIGSTATVTATPVYIRLAAKSNANTYAGNIVLSSAGATAVNVPVSNSIVNRIILTITGGYPKTYGEQLSNYTLYYNDPDIRFDDSKFKNGNTFYSVDISFSAGIAKTDPAGTYNGAVVLSSLKGDNGYLDSNYDVRYDPLPLVIQPADLTVTANNVTKPLGEVKSTETGSTRFTRTALQNSETMGTVTISYGAGAAANATPGTYTGSVMPSLAMGGTFNPSNYAINYVPGNLIVNAAIVPTISTTGAPAAVNTTYGTASPSSSFTVSGTDLTDAITITPPPGFEVSTNNTTFTGTVTLTGGATIANTTVYIRLTSTTNANTYSGNIVLRSSGAQDVNVAMPASKVNKSPLYIQALPVNKPYGSVLSSRVSANGFNYAGGTTLKNGNKIDAVTINYGTGAAATDQVNRYNGSVTIEIQSTSGGYLADNYDVIRVPNYLDVSRAPLTIVLKDVEKTYGSVLTGGIGYTNFEVTGLKNQETIGSITVQYNRGAAAGDVVGAYTAAIIGSVATGGTYNAGNYLAPGFTPGILTVKPATLTITADNKTKLYKEANPPLTFSYGGFVNGENESIITAPPTISTTATEASFVGKYPITLSRQASAPNYKIDFVDALLSITRTGGMALKIPNTFTPNGDGVNDTWLLTDLEDYPNCVVKIYTRYGQEIFTSVGYASPWAGTYKGSNVPSGVYYYVIDPKDEVKVMSGSVTVIR